MIDFSNSKNNAFTYAETMITLLVIGIVVAIIVPSLQNSFEKIVYQTSFADTYKVFNKGLYNYSVGYAGTRTETQEDGSTVEVKKVSTLNDGKLTSIHFFDEGNVIEKLAEQFRGETKNRNCWEGKEILNNFDGSGNSKTNLNDLPCFISGNHFIYTLEVLSSTCDIDMRAESYNNKKHKLEHSCAVLYMDVNGEKAPNTFGKDVYAFIITNNANSSLYPVGGKLMSAIPGGTKISGVSTWENSCDAEHKDGRACAGRLVEQGMKIEYLK